MWTERGKPEKAAPLYEQCELWDLAAESYTHARLFTEGTRSLRSGKLYDQLVDYLYKYAIPPLRSQILQMLTNTKR